jgi:HEAT repeat protein
LYNKTDVELLELLSDKNTWFRQQALLILGDRKNASLMPRLMQMLQGADGQISLEALWAINLAGGFNGDVLQIALHHNDPFVRMWAVRLIGDNPDVSSPIADELTEMSIIEQHPEVRSQLAGNSKAAAWSGCSCDCKKFTEK